MDRHMCLSKSTHLRKQTANVQYKQWTVSTHANRQIFHCYPSFLIALPLHGIRHVYAYKRQIIRQCACLSMMKCVRVRGNRLTNFLFSFILRER